MEIKDYIKALQESCKTRPDFTDTIITDDKMIRIECFNGRICIREYLIKIQKDIVLNPDETEKYLMETELSIKSIDSDNDEDFQGIVKRIRRERNLSDLLD